MPHDKLVLTGLIRCLTAHVEGTHNMKAIHGERFDTGRLGRVSAAGGPPDVVLAGFARAAATVLRKISGVIGLRMKSVAPSFMTSTASSIGREGRHHNHPCVGAPACIRRRTSIPSMPGIF